MSAFMSGLLLSYKVAFNIVMHIRHIQIGQKNAEVEIQAIKVDVGSFE